MAQLLASDLYQLKQKGEAAEATGQDSLVTLAKRVQEQINQARARLKEIL